MPDQAHDPELAALERKLAALVPASGQLNRDQVMFRAGQASLKRAGWFWPAVAGAMTLVAAGLGGVLLLRPQPETEKHIVYVIKEVPQRLAPRPPSPGHRPPTVSSAQSTADEPLYPQTEYYRLENHLLRWGLDGLPGSPPLPPGGPPLTREDLRDRPAKTKPAQGFSPLTFLANFGGSS